MYSHARIAELNDVLETLESLASVQLYEHIAHIYWLLYEALGRGRVPGDHYFGHFEGYAEALHEAQTRLTGLGFYDDFVAYARGQLALVAALGTGDDALAALDEVGRFLDAIVAMDEEVLAIFVHDTSDGEENFESLKAYLLSLYDLAEWLGDDLMDEPAVWSDDQGLPVLM